MSMPGRLRAALTDALKARDRETANVLRSVLAAIANAEAIDAPGVAAGAIESSPVGLGVSDVARRELTEEQIERVARAEIAEREAAARTCEGSGAPSEAARLRREAAVIARLCLDGSQSR